MVVRTTCAECGQALELPDLWAGKAIPCPECEATVRLPLQRSKPDDAWPDKPPAGARPRRQPPTPLEIVEFEEQVECPMCGAEAGSRAEKCPRCGEPLNPRQETAATPRAEFKEEVRLYEARRNSLCVFWCFEAIVGGLLLVAAMNNLRHLPPRLEELLGTVLPALLMGCFLHFMLSTTSMGGSRPALRLASFFSAVLLLASVVTLLGLIFRGGREILLPTFVVIVAVKLMILALTIQVLVWHNRLRELKVLPGRSGSL